MIELAWSSSPKLFLQVYIYYYTEWLTSGRVPRLKSNTDIFILIQNDWACVEFFAQTFLVVMNINIQVERNCSPKNVYQYNTQVEKYIYWIKIYAQIIYAVQSDFLWK